MIIDGLGEEQQNENNNNPSEILFINGRIDFDLNKGGSDSGLCGLKGNQNN